MTWTTPLTAAVNTALTAAQWNASVRDNLNETEPAKATVGGRLIVTTTANAIAEREIVADIIGAAEGTTNGGYVDLATIGPDVTITTGTKGLVSVGGYTSNNSATGRGWMSHEIAGASTAPPSDSRAAIFTSSAVNELHGASQITLWTTLTPGSSNFKAKYRTSTLGTSTFTNRRIMVVAL